MPLLVPVSVGELCDKISILELKLAAITDPAKRANVAAEFAALDGVRRREVDASPALNEVWQELRTVNRRLWQIEDDLRRLEREDRFDGEFVELARAVYQNNDRRAVLKRRINALTGSEIVEEKTYV
ncbi:MAG TPA: DUF6165 family protein [Stellaceae bacterium]|nr:DUF6165 family protein [Stellaceae bacterium]